MVKNVNAEPVDGVIKFCSEHSYSDKGVPDLYEMIEAWRQVFWRLGLIGQDPARYEGAGYGNISLRCQAGFIISGTQTGHKPVLDRSDYALIMESDIEHNKVYSLGETRPSSESLTHAAIYCASTVVGSVVHVHSPLIWSVADCLDIVNTPESIAYGTPEMAKALARVIEKNEKSNVAIMKGHLDGVIAWGDTIDSAGMEIVSLYALAKKLSKQKGANA